MAAIARFAQIEHSAPRDDFAAVLNKDIQQILEVAQARLAVYQRHHIDAEGVLQLRLLVQVVEYHLGHFAALELNHQAHAGFVRLILDVADAFELFLVHQFGNAFLQRLFIDLVRQLVYHDGLALAFVQVFKMAFGAHYHAPAPGAVAVFHALNAVDDATRGEIGRRHNLHQIFQRGRRLAQQMQAGIDHFVQVVRRNIGCHAHGNAARAVDEQIGQASGQNGRLQLLAVVVGHHIDRLLVDIGQNLAGNLLQPTFRITVSGGAVAINRAEVALPVDERVAHRKVLRHAHQGFVRGQVAVRVEATEHITHHAGAFHIRAVPDIVGLVHRKQHAAVHGFEAVTGIGQGAPHNYAHGVIQIAAPHLLF